MRRIFTPALSLVFALPVVALIANPARAHDLRGIVAEQELVAPEIWSKIEEIRKWRQFLSAANTKSKDLDLEAVIDTSVTWPTNRISICFLNGVPDARIHVMQVAQRWMESTGLQLDFGSIDSPRSCEQMNPSDVRVSLAGLGNWAQVGREAQLIGPGSPTMNLEGMNKTVFNERDDGIILHEFGHAIGFQHEHQSPVSVCEKEFNWDSLYKRMAEWAGWSRARVDRNMRQLEPSTKLSATTFDPASIMLYNLRREDFRDDIAQLTCYIPEPNNTISNTDREAAARVYLVAVSMRSLPRKRSLSAPHRDAAITKAIARLRELTDRR